jgi:CO/xanthine dehydrogenase Mo-binding subunit
VLIENNTMAPQGCGEPACTTVGAVLANAVCDALGVRLYELPMTPERIKAASACVSFLAF